MTIQQNQEHIANDNEIDLKELFKAIWKGKWIVIIVTALFTVAAVFYALTLPNIYKSEVTLAPVSEQSGMQIPGQLGGLAALAGVNLGGMAGGDKTALALEILKSREFIGRFIEKNDLYLHIMGAKGWNREGDKLIINPKVFDEKKQEWVRNVSQPFQPKPSNLETIEEFKKIFSVNKDKTTGMVTLSLEHYSPYLAKSWLDKMVKSINEEMRTRELAEAERSITYLNSQIAQTNLADVRSMLFSLIEEQIKTLMLANVRVEYIFKTVDPAVIEEKKAKPARALIVTLIAFLGVMLSSVLVLVRYFKSI